MKRRGSQYEAAFMAQALKHGLDILESYGDYMPYDIVVHNTDGRLIRVQVKGTNSQIDKRPGYKIFASCGNANRVALSPAKVDVLAAYVEPEDMWYLIPVVKLKGNISPAGRRRRWRGAWLLSDCRSRLPQP